MMHFKSKYFKNVMHYFVDDLRIYQYIRTKKNKNLYILSFNLDIFCTSTSINVVCLLWDFKYINKKKRKKYTYKNPQKLYF